MSSDPARRMRRARSPKEPVMSRHNGGNFGNIILPSQQEAAQQQQMLQAVIQQAAQQAAQQAQKTNDVQCVATLATTIHCELSLGHEEAVDRACLIIAHAAKAVGGGKLQRLLNEVAPEAVARKT